MANVNDFIKLPNAKWAVWVITAGAALFVAAKIVDSIFQAQVYDLQKKIMKYQIAEYTAKYGDIDAGTLQGAVDGTATTIYNTVAKVV